MVIDIDGSKKQKIIFLLIAAVSFLSFFIFKYGGMLYVRVLFEQGRTDILNAVLGVSPETPSLTYYLGLAERYMFGPISQLCAFMALIFAGVVYLPRTKPLHFGLTIFIFFLISKWEVLFFPPYGDAIAGPTVEAWWLAAHNFDYAGLARMPDYSQGGPRTYLFSIYPTYAALWMKLLRSPSVYFPVMHTVVFGMVAITAALLREISRKILCDTTAFLLTVVFLALPLTQSQTEAMNMEAPCLFFITWSAFFLIRRRVMAASLAALGAVAVKGTGILACGAVACVVFIFAARDLFKERRLRVKYLACMLMLVAVPFLKLFSKYLIQDSHVSAGMVGLLNGWPSFKTIHFVRWFGASLLVYVTVMIVHWKRGKKLSYDAGIMYLYGTAFFLLLLNFFAVSSRYCFNVMPFLVFACVYAMCLLVPSRKGQGVILTGAALWAAFVSYGQFWGTLKDHVTLERSLEYRNDLYVVRETAQTIETSYPNFTIGAPMQYAQILAIKELGYVTKDLNVFIYGFSCKYGGIGEFAGIRNLNLNRTVFVGHDNDGPRKARIVPDYPVGPKDRIIKEVAFGNQQAWIFMGGIEIEKLFRAIQLLLYQQKLNHGHKP